LDDEITRANELLGAVVELEPYLPGMNEDVIDRLRSMHAG
jgi:hypothetical protein